MEKMRLSRNCAINVDTYERMANSSLPPDLLRKAQPISQLSELFISAETRNATVLPSSINHVPPKIPSKAL